MEQVQETIMVCVPWQVKVVILLPAAQALVVSLILFPTLFFVVLDLVITMVQDLEKSMAQDLEITMAQDQEISLAQDLEIIMVLDLVITMVQDLENSLAQDLEITLEQVQETIMVSVPYQVKVVILRPAAQALDVTLILLPTHFFVFRC